MIDDIDLDLDSQLASDVDAIDDHDQSIYNNQNHSSRYITESQMNDFFNFSDLCALNLMHINCRSLKKNFEPVKNFLNFLSVPISVLAVTETWLNDSLHDVFFIKGYNFFSKCRINKSGGGVGLYVNSELSCKVRTDLCRMTEHLECIFVESHQPKQ